MDGTTLTTILNLSHIEELKAMDDDGSCDTLRELISLFKTSSQKNFSDMKSFFANKDLDAMRKSAHALRSSSLNLGGVLFPESLLKIEYSAQTPESEIESHIKASEIEYANFVSALSRICSN